MDDLFNKAIVLIYPDGYVDRIPIKRDIDDHVKYFYEYLKVSKRFQSIVKDNGFRFDWNHEYIITPIIKLLTDNGVILIINFAIAYINMAPERAEELAMYSITFPKDYKEHLGIPFVKETIKKMNPDRYELDKYYEEMNNFDNFDPDEADEFINEKKDKGLI